MFCVVLRAALFLWTCGAALTSAEVSSLFNFYKNTALVSNAEIISRKKAVSAFSCASFCGREDACGFANFDEKGKSCILIKGTGYYNSAKRWIEKEDFTGLEKVKFPSNDNDKVTDVSADNVLLRAKETNDSAPVQGQAEVQEEEEEEAISALGTTSDQAVLNCKTLREKNVGSLSGVYWIDPDGTPHDNAFRAYCDQATDGGGWTLVWSYHFKRYDVFDARNNAVMPFPTWNFEAKNGQSTTPPQSETDYQAVDYNVWEIIGTDVLIKSNINNWFACTAMGGSLVTMQEGNMNCRLVQEVNSMCTTAPNALELKTLGPAFVGPQGTYYYFESKNNADWPIHDPCGTSQANHLNDVSNPHGNIFVR